jgi:broad specificity phosphatase PhoE
MKLYLARHGQTNYNALDICNTDPSVDVHLTPLGVTQAEELARALQDAHFDRIFVSEMKRTVQTAEVINEHRGLELEVDTRLNDIRSGFEGKPFKEYMKTLDAAENRWTARVNGGESIDDMKTRATAFMDELRSKDYGAVLIVTSEWIIRAMLANERNLTNEQAWAVEMRQGDCTELEI